MKKIIRSIAPSILILSLGLFGIIGCGQQQMPYSTTGLQNPSTTCVGQGQTGYGGYGAQAGYGTQAGYGYSNQGQYGYPNQGQYGYNSGYNTNGYNPCAQTGYNQGYYPTGH